MRKREKKKEKKTKSLAYFLVEDNQLKHNYENSDIKHFNREAHLSNHLKYEPGKEFDALGRVLESCQSILTTQKNHA